MGERHIIETEKALDLNKADTFYEIKNQCKLKAKQGLIIRLSFDYMQNLPLPHIPMSFPHISTGDAFLQASFSTTFLGYTIWKLIDTT